MDDSTIITSASPPIATSSDSNFLEWGPVEIENWLNNHRFEHDIITSFTVNNIVGETLPFLETEHLKEMGIPVSERIRLKLEINKLLSENGYIKETDCSSLLKIIKNLNDLIQSDMNNLTIQLNDELIKYKEDVTALQKPLPTPDKNNYPSSPFNLSSPTKTQQQQQQHQLQRKQSEIKQHNKSARNSLLFQQQQSSSSMPTASSTSLPSSSSTSNIQTISPHSPTSTLKHPHSSSSNNVSTIPSHPVSEPLKQLRASTDDPCSKILQAAMKRHKLHDEDWRNYALVICYGDKERILELDEKPVLIFKELKEKGEHPAIMLRQKVSDYFNINPGNNNGSEGQTPGGKL